MSTNFTSLAAILYITTTPPFLASHSSSTSPKNIFLLFFIYKDKIRAEKLTLNLLLISSVSFIRLNYTITVVLQVSITLYLGLFNEICGPLYRNPN